MITRDRQYYKNRRLVRSMRTVHRNFRHNSCVRKSPFSSEDEAIEVCEYLRHAYRDYTLNVYRCVFCLNYHLGHQRRGLNRVLETRRRTLIWQLTGLLGKLVQRKQTDALLATSGSDAREKIEVRTGLSSQSYSEVSA